MVAFLFEVTDPAGLQKYRNQAGLSVNKYGRKLVMRSESIEVADGDWTPIGLIMLEFENLERAKERHNSLEYRPVRPMRHQASNSGVIFVGGAYLTPSPFGRGLG